MPGSVDFKCSRIDRQREQLNSTEKRSKKRRERKEGREGMGFVLRKLNTNPILISLPNSKPFKVTIKDK